VILAAAADLHTNLAALRIWMIGGEPLTSALTCQFYEQLPGAALINFYGLTEGDATYHVTSPGFHYDTNVPIGRAVQDTRVYLLDENLKAVPDGQAGEICLAGEGLSHKYLNCPELNAERWVPNPFATDGSYARLFRTGDTGRVNSDGQIEYLGRRGRLIKVRGFRVELDEVEAVLAQHPAVDQGVAVAKQPGGKGDASSRHQMFIVAYAVLKHGKAVSSDDLREFLQDRLPDHALPSMIFFLDALPLSANGKIDFYALSQLELVEREECETGLVNKSSLPSS
jgi:acyl-CoA synthetase (AMP-forming)/AMP-acid ligase II